MNLLNQLYNELVRYKEVLKDKADIILPIIKQLKDNINDNDFKRLVDCIDAIRNQGVLLPVHFNDRYFTKREGRACSININYPDIVIPFEDDDRIINLYPFKTFVKKLYDLDVKALISEPNNLIESSTNKLYLNKGGIITGEYTDIFVIKKEYIEANRFIPTIITVPVSIIVEGNSCYYCVDHRDKCLKELAKLYDYEWYIDENIKNKHINLRKFKK